MTFDHLVVAADTLERGIAHVEHCLGERCTAGGRHPGLGTHNALLGLGHDRYIEVIAVDPRAQAPTMPRWFGLDDPAVRAALRERPRLLTWVARCGDLDEAVAACVHDAGQPRPMQRDDLHWRIAFPADGALIEGGLVPPLIEWGSGVRHPARRLPDAGLRLHALHGVHPDPNRVRKRLAPLSLNDVLALEAGGTGEAVRLRAGIETPSGLRWLD
ncbi:MAG: VOC family protein [Halofilum sp. (in: g-proteobacteria)]